LIDKPPLDDSDTLVPFVLVGDDAYPLKTFIMKPFGHKKMTDAQRIFNYRLSRCRRCVECAFGILTAKWRLLNKAIETEVEKAEKIIKCMCLLHNLIIDKDNITLNQRVIEDAVQEYQEQHETPHLGGRRFNRSSTAAQEVRNFYKDYFNGSGSALWQNQMVFN
ncbi:hypothetical protein PPYR_01128, partial [Photinus pyralis]